MELFKVYDFTFTLIHIIDLVLVLAIGFQLYRLLRGSLAFNMLIGLFTIFVVWKVVSVLQMPIMEGILNQFVRIGFIAILIVFQQEIRKFLLLIGKGSFVNGKRSIFSFLPWNWKVEKGFQTNFEDIIDACDQLAQMNAGALIVLPKTSEMKFIGASGEVIDAYITKRLLLSIFNKTSPLHDGAVIIASGKIKAANAVLPISENPEAQAKYGLRHLSALGITEQTDAIAIIVSEERGTIAIAKEGKLNDQMSKQELVDFLNKEFASEMVSVGNA